MAKRNLTPEEFIRDYIKRGFSREQILSRASKKDLGFYRLVNEILNHTTLIEKIEKQVDCIQQSQINFEKQSYSSKTLLDDIEKRKNNDKELRVLSKPKDNGRSNLPIHTDLNMNDLEAPLPNTYKSKKISFTISNKKNDLKDTKETSLFDEDQQEITNTPKMSTSENKLLIYPKVQNQTISDETSKLPETKSENKIDQLNNEILTESKIEESSDFTDVEKAILIAKLKQKELLLAELNRNLSNKEATIHVDRKIAVERKTQQAEVIKDLRQKSSIYRLGLYLAIGIFTATICFIKLMGDNTASTNNQVDMKLSNLEKLRKMEEYYKQNKQVTPIDSTSEDLTDNNIPPTDVIEKTTPKVEQVNHLIKKGESFWKITAKYFGQENAHHYKKVMKYNGLSNESAPVGKTIKIPSLAELELE